MSQKKKELFTRSYRSRNRGTGPQSEQNISYNNNRVSVNYEGIDFDTLSENELLKISTQISSELEENSKGENSANNHVNTNVPILTDRRQVYISPNIEQTIDHSSSECKTPVEDIDPVQNNVNDDPDTTSEYQKYITSTPNPTNDGGCNVTTQDKNEAERTTYQSDNSKANSKDVEEGYNGYSCTASSNDKCQSPTSLSRSPDIMTVHKQGRRYRHEKGDDNRRRHQYQAIEETYKETQKKATNSHSSEEQTNTSRRGEGCDERYDDHLQTCLSSTSSRNDVTGHHKSDERRRSNTRDGDNRFERRHPPTSNHRNIVHARESDRRRPNTPFENKRPMKRQHGSSESDSNRSRKYQRMEKEDSSCDKNFTSNDSRNCTVKRLDLGVNDARQHILERSDLGYTRKPESSDLRNAHTRGPGRRSVRGDTHKQESAYRTTNEYSKNCNGKRKINNAECDTTQHKLSKICEETSDGRSSKPSRTAEGLDHDARNDLSIFPDISEIEDFEHSNIPENFNNESEYLTRLFMVHRQDFIRPLCKGLCDLKKDIVKNPSCLNKRWTHDYIRVYRNIQFLSRCCNQQNDVTWRISFDVAQYRKINWLTRKLLTFGSLVCLTNTSFSFIQYGTVAERKPKDLKQGHVEINFIEHSAISSMFRQTNDIILVESQAFFPAYFHTLESIKNMHGLVSTKKGKLPFGEQLVSLCVNIEQPKYLRSTSSKEGFDFSCFGSGLGTIDISREQNWPKASTLSLDDSQYGAFVTAMKSKLALIQGPPGTGKTMVGLKIVELLLNNIHIWRNENDEKDGPFLLISYTNRALDQFLLEITKRVPGLK